MVIFCVIPSLDRVCKAEKLVFPLQGNIGACSYRCVLTVYNLGGVYRRDPAKKSDDLVFEIVRRRGEKTKLFQSLHDLKGTNVPYKENGADVMCNRKKNCNSI